MEYASRVIALVADKKAHEKGFMMQRGESVLLSKWGIVVLCGTMNGDWEGGYMFSSMLDINIFINIFHIFGNK